MQFNIDNLFAAFIAEDERIYNDDKIGVENYGHPFTICTNGARWLKATFFPDAKVVGYAIDDNPTAEIGQDIFGHDFLLVDDRYIIDFWYRHVVGRKDAPILLDITTQKELVGKYYGDPTKWEQL